MLMSICSSVLFMFGNGNKLKLETDRVGLNVVGWGLGQRGGTHHTQHKPMHIHRN